MRFAGHNTKEGQKIIVEGMDLRASPWMKKAQDLAPGYTFSKRNGAASGTDATHPHQQLDRLVGKGLNPQDFFKGSKQMGLNPAESVLKKRSGPGLPGEEKEKKKKKKKKKGKKKKASKKKK